MLKLIRVKGNSLRPEVQDGDIVLILTWRRLWRLNPGDRVVFRQPEYGTLIKKIERRGPGADQVFVTGTNAASVDSYEFGPVPLGSILGKVIFCARR
jgi:signal peptidase I